MADMRVRELTAVEKVVSLALLAEDQMKVKELDWSNFETVYQFLEYGIDFNADCNVEWWKQEQAFNWWFDGTTGYVKAYFKKYWKSLMQYRAEAA